MPETDDNAAMSTLTSARRLRAIQRAGLGPNLDDPALARLRRIAARSLDAPITFFSVVSDEDQCFPTHAGLDSDVAAKGRTPLSHSMCRFVVTSCEPLVVPSTADDDRFTNHPARIDLGIESYLGVPISDVHGNVLGALCVADRVPRSWTSDDVAIMRDIGDSLEAHLSQTRLERISRARLSTDVLTRDFEEALSELATATNRAETLRGVAEQLVGRGRAAVGATLISLAIRREQELEFIHGPGVPAEVARRWQRGSLGDDIPMAHALRDNITIHLADENAFEDYPLFREAAEDMGLGSFRAIPFSDPTTDLEGVIGVGWPEPLDESEIPHTLGQVVSLTVQCLHRGWLFDVEQEHARLLERVVLPSALPESLAYDIAGAYVAPRADQRVGGDLYDVVVRDDGAVGVLVADAVGHDLIATRAASRLRHAVGVLTVSGQSPAAIMSAVNRYVLASPSKRLVTCVYLLFSARGDQVTIANAGHPPPLLRDHGKVTTVGPVGQPLLGLEATQTYAEATIDISHNATLLAYTDGLIDSRLDDLLDPEQWLEGYLAAEEGQAAATMASELTRVVTQWDSADDIAFVFVRPKADGRVDENNLLVSQWDAETCRLGDVRAAIRDWASDDLTPELLHDIVLAAGELVTNAREAVDPAGPSSEIGLRVLRRAAVIDLEVSSAGELFDHERSMPGPESERGRGLAIVAELADAVALREADGVVTVSARFSLETPRTT